MLKCPFCYFENEDGVLFCEQCKSDLSGVASTPSHAAPVHAAPVHAMPVMAEPVMAEPVPVLAEEVPVLAEAVPVLAEEVPVLHEHVPVLAEEVPVLDLHSALAPPPAPTPAAAAPVVAAPPPPAPAPVAVAPPPPPPPAPAPVAVAPPPPPPPAPAPVAAAPAAPSAPAPAAPAPAAPAAGSALQPGAQPKLIVLRGQKRNAEYPIFEGQNFLGRADEKPVDIDLEDQEPPERVWCSRQHALITFENSVLAIEDLNSANGTFVNRAKIYPGQPKTLAVNDIIQIGNVQMKVVV
jgi:hypothetical protein